ncbi:hypothetical protein [Frigidibacter sp.]|uniref:hypothetical protein n=1 Tax=Frigidibacter sp. TaxID=2586418 RepID=UPI002734D913|nr:hypothetical protein [Frigidibacter sp.]MDP3342390.1 hypothetical protein [Frigidibacter sp.]
MNVVIGTVMIWAAALWTLRHLQRIAPDRLPQVHSEARHLFLMMLPRTIIGLTGAGFMAELLPQDDMRALFGPGSGLTGVILASGLGALVPGGPVVAFAVGAAALKAGAGVAALLAFVTGWSIFSMTRTLTHEAAMMGWSFLGQRLLVSWPAPLIIGGIGLGLAKLLGLE